MLCRPCGVWTTQLLHCGLYFWPVWCDGISTEVCPINGSKPTWMLWWKRETCNLRGRTGASGTAFLFVHSPDLDPFIPALSHCLHRVLFSEFPWCGQSTDVFKQNLSSLPTSLPLSDILSCNRTCHICEDGQGIACKWSEHMTDIEQLHCPSAKILNQPLALSWMNVVRTVIKCNKYKHNCVVLLVNKSMN